MFGLPVVKRCIYLFTLISESRLIELVYLRNIKLISLPDLTFSSVTLVIFTTCYKSTLVNRFGMPVVNCSATLR